MRASRFVLYRISTLLVAVLLLLVANPGVVHSATNKDDDDGTTTTTTETCDFAEADDKNDGSCQNAPNIRESLKTFLQTTVFGQGAETSGDEPETPAGWKPPRPFLSYLESRRKANPLNDDPGEDSNEKNNDSNKDTEPQRNPFLGFLEAVQQTKASILGEGTKTSSTAFRNEQLLATVLDKARLLAQKDDEAMELREFIARMKEAFRKVTRQLQDHFGELVSTHLDAYLALAIPYFANFQDSQHSPLQKRRLHRFYPRVTKEEWIDLHEALYLSQLAYVDTMEQFEQGLAKFDGGVWKKLYGTTKSLPDEPASFLIIHQELDPLEGSGNSKKKSKASSTPKPQNDKQPLSVPPWESLQNLLQPQKQPTEVLVTLVVRGTKHVSDLLSDALLEPVAYRGGYAHGGILASGKNLARKYLPRLQDLHNITQRDKIRVVLIGHSLGAGAAAIAAMELREHEFLEVEAWGFGCPSLLSKELSESTQDYVTTVVNDADIITRMSGASMTNILLDLMEYDWTNDALEDLRFSLERARESFPEVRGLLPDTDKALEWFEARLNETVRPKLAERQAKGPAERLPSVLIPPGRCIHLFRDGYGRTGTYTPCDGFASVEFSLTLVDDHLVLNGYHRAMLGAAQDSDRDYSFQFPNDIHGIVGV